MPLEKLQESFGQWGDALYRKSRGEDAFEFFLDAEAKSISHNHTFGVDTEDTVALHSTLSHLGQKTTKRLRDAGLSARTLTLTIRNSDFQTTSHAKTFAESTNLDAVILTTLRELFDARWQRNRKVRLLGAALSSFSHGEKQLDMLEGPRKEKLERLARATDKLRDRFGFSKIQYGGSLDRKNESED